jgi:hypothetical protein
MPAANGRQAAQEEISIDNAHVTLTGCHGAPISCE